MNNRRSQDVSTSQLIERTRELVEKTTHLAADAQGIRTELDSVKPTVEQTNSTVAVIDLKIGAAGQNGNHDESIAKLQQKKAENLAALFALKPVLVANLRYWWRECDAQDIRLDDRLDMTPYGESSEREKIIQQRNELRRSCHSDEIRPTLTSAYYLQREALRDIPETEQSKEDRDAKVIFIRALNGGPTGYLDIRPAANYLESLSATKGR